MKRKLVSIQVVSDLRPIPGADRIEQATVMGWYIIVKKSEFKVGDRCVFFEIDSMLPDGPEWPEFMRSKKFRVKTLKMRGVLSQGLVMPLSILGGPNPKRSIWDRIRRRDGWKIGDDVTEFLKVIKHDSDLGAPGFKTGLRANNFPAFIPKTDEIRIQSDMDLLDRIKGRSIYSTVKCDGTSSTFYKLNGKFGVCSRNREVQPGDNVYWQIAELYDLEKDIPEGYAIQGEICGPRICKNRLRLISLKLFVFDMFDIKAGEYCSYSTLKDFCANAYLDTVPIESVYPIGPIDNSLAAWLARAKGKYDGTNVNREGIVVRTTNGDRISFKILNNDFLLKEED